MLRGRRSQVAIGGFALLAMLVLVGVAIDSWRLAVLGLALLVLGVAVLQVLLLERQRHTAHTRRVRQLETRLAETSENVTRESTRLQRVIDRRGSENVQDVEALMQLFTMFTPRAAMPSTGRYALHATGILRLVDLIRTKRIRTVVELGCGTSTLWLAYALERAGGGQIHAFDHDQHFAELTRTSVEAHGFDAVTAIDVRVAPLNGGALSGHETPWYDTSAFDAVTGIDLLLVDGPPKGTGELARYPALPVLADRLAPGAIVYVDDSGREPETRMVARWCAAYPALQPLEEGGPGRELVLQWRP